MILLTFIVDGIDEKNIHLLVEETVTLVVRTRRVTMANMVLSLFESTRIVPPSKTTSRTQKSARYRQRNIHQEEERHNHNVVDK
jgi:hypothetical protein